MNEKDSEPRSCFGVLDRVFPLQPDGLRQTPENCLHCPHKTACLRAAIKSRAGVRLSEEKVNRAYQAGAIGFWARWSRRKMLKQRQSSRKRRSGGAHNGGGGS